MRPFAYFEPTSIAEACALAREYGARGKFLAGGTDLLVRIKKFRHETPAAIINLKSIPGLAVLAPADGTGLRIGAHVTLEALLEGPLIARDYPVLAATAAEMGGPGIRNLATVIGNLCNASPAADLSLPLLALDARVRVVGEAGDREVPLDVFFTGPGRTVLEQGELVTEVVLPPPGGAVAFIKHGLRRAMAIATVGVAARVALDADGRVAEARVALGAVAPTAFRSLPAEEALVGRVPTRAVLDAAAAAAEAESRPISDYRASATYRREMVRVLTRRALGRAVDAAGRGARV